MKNKTRNALKQIKHFWKNTDAQDLVEYALLLVMMALAVAATVKSVGASITNAFLGAATQMSELNLPGNVSNTGAVGGGLAGNTAVDNAAANVNANAANAANNAANAAQAGRTNVAAADDRDATGADLAAAGFDVAAGFAAALGTTAQANAAAALANANAVAAAEDVADAAGKVAVTNNNGGFISTGVL